MKRYEYFLSPILFLGLSGLYNSGYVGVNFLIFTLSLFSFGYFTHRSIGKENAARYTTFILLSLALTIRLLPTYNMQYQIDTIGMGEYFNLLETTWNARK